MLGLGGQGRRAVVETDVGCVADVRHSLYGTASACLCRGCYSQRLLPQEYGDCTGLETEVSIFSTKVAEP